MEYFVITYQPLIGSFLAITSSVFLWYLKHLFDERKQFKNSEKEIENIFLYASRESEEAFKNLEYYVSGVRNSLSMEKEGGMHVFVPPKFSRINLNEDRLFQLKSKLDFTTSQQIDIAMSSARTFNGFMDGFERTPEFIFEASARLVETGFETKEESSKDYYKSIKHELDKIESMLKKEILTSQRHLLRPVASIASKKHLKGIPKEMLDGVLDEQTDLILAAVKIDLE